MVDPEGLSDAVRYEVFDDSVASSPSQAKAFRRVRALVHQEVAVIYSTSSDSLG